MNYEVAPFPLNNPLTPTTLEVHAMVLAHCMRRYINHIYLFYLTSCQNWYLFADLIAAYEIGVVV